MPCRNFFVPPPAEKKRTGHDSNNTGNTKQGRQLADKNPADRYQENARERSKRPDD